MPKKGKPRDNERDAMIDGVHGFMLDADGFVLPKWREHVAALRKRPEMCEIGEVVQAATSRTDVGED